METINNTCTLHDKSIIYNNLILTTTKSNISSSINKFIEKVITYKPNLNFILEIKEENLLCPILCIYKSLMFLGYHSFDFHSEFEFYLNLALQQRDELLNYHNIKLEKWEEDFIEILQLISIKEKPLTQFLEYSRKHNNDLLAFKLGMVVGLSVGNKEYIKELADNYYELHENHKLSGFIGIYSFILQELKMFDESEEWVLKGMKIDPDNIWIQHVYSHILYQTNRIKESIEILEPKKINWQSEANSFLNKHIRWHLAVSYLEEENYKISNEIIEEIIRMGFDEAECPLSILGYIIRVYIRTDSVSIIKDYDWVEILFEYFQNTHIYTRHMLFDVLSLWLVAFIENLKDEKYKKFRPELILDKILTRIKLNVQSEEIQKSSRKVFYEEIYLNVCKGIIFFGQGKFKECLEIFFPKLNFITKIGASDEQIFPLIEITLYCSAICQDQKKFDSILKNYYGEDIINLKYLKDIRKKLSENKN